MVQHRLGRRGDPVVTALSAMGSLMKVHIEYQDQFGHWRHYGTYHHAASTYRYARQLASRTGKRHRLVDGDGRLLDIVNP